MHTLLHTQLHRQSLLSKCNLDASYNVSGPGTVSTEPSFRLFRVFRKALTLATFGTLPPGRISGGICDKRITRVWEVVNTRNLRKRICFGILSLQFFTIPSWFEAPRVWNATYWFSPFHRTLTLHAPVCEWKAGSGEVTHQAEATRQPPTVLYNIAVQYDSTKARNDLCTFIGHCHQIPISNGCHYIWVVNSSLFQANGISTTELWCVKRLALFPLSVCSSYFQRRTTFLEARTLHLWHIFS